MSIERGFNPTYDLNPTWSALDSEEITKSDTVDFTKGNGVARGIYVGGAGDVAVVHPDDTVTVFESVPAGTILPVFAKRVNSTSTSASKMVALF